MGRHSLYGFCVGCGQWIPRDEMLSIHLNLFDAHNQKEVVRHRYCVGCFTRERERALSLKWDHVVVTEQELLPLADGGMPPPDVVRERHRVARQAGEGDSLASERE